MQKSVCVCWGQVVCEDSVLYILYFCKFKISLKNIINFKNRPRNIGVSRRKEPYVFLNSTNIHGMVSVYHTPFNYLKKKVKTT